MKLRESTANLKTSQVLVAALRNDSPVVISNEVHERLLKYLIDRLKSDSANRNMRIERYSAVDKRILGWIKHTAQDSERLRREDESGAPQAVAIHMPVAETHIEDTVAFFTEIYAPQTGGFLSNQGDPKDVDNVSRLASRLQTDGNREQFYSELTKTIRDLCKYNVGGFWLDWSAGKQDRLGPSRSPGNVSRSIDLYNFFYDPIIGSIDKLRENGEWCAQISLANNYVILRGIAEGRYRDPDKFEYSRGLLDAESSLANKEAGGPAYYRASDQAGVSRNGRDTKTNQRGVGNTPDFEAIGLGDAGFGSGSTVARSHKLTRMSIWLNPAQVGLSNKHGLKLYHFEILDDAFILTMTEDEYAIELPVYISYFTSDEMTDATRSPGERFVDFQRHISFQANIAIAAERSNTYGIRGYDPTMFDPANMKSGESAGWLASKVAGRDVRTGVMKISEDIDTTRQYNAIASLLGIMKDLYPAQALPASVTSIDRAVQSQVAAIKQGSTRRLHMQVSDIDAKLMNPHRLAMFRNYINYGEGNEFAELREEIVAKLLNSGLGQLNRELAAASVERILFTLIQNPESAADYDMPQFFEIWSQLTNLGFNLGKLLKKGTAGVQGAQPVPTPEEQAAMAAAAQGGGGGQPQAAPAVTL